MTTDKSKLPATISEEEELVSPLEDEVISHVLAICQAMNWNVALIADPYDGEKMIGLAVGEPELLETIADLMQNKDHTIKLTLDDMN